MPQISNLKNYQNVVYEAEGKKLLFLNIICCVLLQLIQ